MLKNPLTASAPPPTQEEILQQKIAAIDLAIGINQNYLDPAARRAKFEKHGQQKYLQLYSCYQIQDLIREKVALVEEQTLLHRERVALQERSNFLLRIEHPEAGNTNFDFIVHVIFYSQKIQIISLFTIAC